MRPLALGPFTLPGALLPGEPGHSRPTPPLGVAYPSAQPNSMNPQGPPVQRTAPDQQECLVRGHLPTQRCRLPRDRTVTGSRGGLALLEPRGAPREWPAIPHLQPGNGRPELRQWTRYEMNSPRPQPDHIWTNGAPTPMKRAPGDITATKKAPEVSCNL